MRFGIRVPTHGTARASAEFAKRVEDAGFDFMWMPDTPLLAGRWRDIYVHLAASALATTKLRLGPGVTNPLTRHPIATASAILAIDELSEGRADLVAGTGYSSAYIIGKKAATLAQMRECTTLWRDIFAGNRTELGGLAIELTPAAPKLPIYLAASGPKMLRLAGAIADGVLIMVGASVGAVSWALEHVDAGLADAGRTRESLKRILVVTACADDDKRRAIDEMRPCAASLYRHAFADTLLARSGLAVPDQIPPQPQVYPDLHHAVDWEEAKRACAFVPDDAVEALVALGTGDDLLQRARALETCDVDAIWWRDEASYAPPERLMNALAESVLPRYRR